MSSRESEEPMDLVCANCGSEIKTGFQFCPECGHPVVATPRTPEPPATVRDVPERSEWLLAVLNGPAQGGAYPVGGELLIGRDEGCDLILPDPKVSRRHASIERSAENTFWLTDLASSNGTFLREERVDRVELIPGAEFRVGSTRMTLVPSAESCAQCGHPVDPSSDFCGNCGHPVGEPAEVDLERLAAELEVQARGRVDRTEAIEPPAVSASAISEPVAGAPAAEAEADRAGTTGRWLAIGCGILSLITASVVCCSFLLPILEGL